MKNLYSEADKIGKSPDIHGEKETGSAGGNPPTGRHFESEKDNDAPPTGVIW